VPWVRQCRGAPRLARPAGGALEEHRPPALWQRDDERPRLVNSFGEVFEANVGDVEDDRCRCCRPDASAAMLAMLQRLQPVLAPAAHARPAGAERRGSWRGRAGQRRQVEIGRGSDDEVSSAQRFVARCSQVTRPLPPAAGVQRRPAARRRLCACAWRGLAPRRRGAGQELEGNGTDMAKEYKDLVVGLDIGTAKVMAVVAEVPSRRRAARGRPRVAPTHGLKRGVVVNIDATVQSIQQALKEAEMMADCKITRVYTGITGSHIRGQNSTGMVIVRDKEVTPVDVARVVETAKAINIPNDQRLLLVSRRSS
jgi:hypothetical protein